MEKALILGAGPVGRALGAELKGRGVEVRYGTRSGRGPEGFETAAVDAEDPEAVTRAAQGVQILVHAVGAAYPQWAQVLPRVQAAVLQAAEVTGAVAVFVDNLYAYAPGAMPMTEATPRTPVTRKGALRKTLEDQWLAAHRAGKVKAVAVQASDYFGPGSTRSDTSHLGSRFFPSFEAGKKAAFLGDPDQPHSLTYLPDFARALADVALTPAAWGRSWICPSVGPTTFRTVAEALAAEAGVKAQVGNLPAFLVKVLGFVNPMIREVEEMLIQFDRPFTVDSRAFEAQFGWKATDLGTAVKSTWAAHRASAPKV